MPSGPLHQTSLLLRILAFTACTCHHPHSFIAITCLSFCCLLEICHLYHCPPCLLSMQCKLSAPDCTFRTCTPFHIQMASISFRVAEAFKVNLSTNSRFELKVQSIVYWFLMNSLQHHAKFSR